MSVNIDLENTISFERPLTRVVKQNIRIENPHGKPVAFKVKTTAPKLYCVRPNSNIIAPGEFADVQIMLQAFREEPPFDVKCKDKFLILSTEVNEPVESVDLQEFWARVETKSKTSIHERKLRCVYTQPGEATTAASIVPQIPKMGKIEKKLETATEVLNKPAELTARSTNATKETSDADKKLQQMEAELERYKKEVETLRENETVVIENVQVKTTSPLSIFILFSLLAVAVAYFFTNKS